MKTDEIEGGYGRPPRTGRFQKGQSGNPRGRPKGSQRRPPYDSVLGQMVNLRSGSQAREMTAEEAFFEKLAELALKGSNAAAHSIEKLRELRTKLVVNSPANIPRFVIRFTEPGFVDTALETLKIATMLDRYNATKASMAIEPWAVEAALARFGARKLSREDQETVLVATRTPKKVAWPDWWEVLPE